MNKSRVISLNKGTQRLLICSKCASTIVFGHCGFCEDVDRANAKVRNNQSSLWEEMNRFYVYCLITCLASAVVMVFASML